MATLTPSSPRRPSHPQRRQHAAAAGRSSGAEDEPSAGGRQEAGPPTAALPPGMRPLSAGRTEWHTGPHWDPPTCQHACSAARPYPGMQAPYAAHQRRRVPVAQPAAQPRTAAKRLPAPVSDALAADVRQWPGLAPQAGFAAQQGMSAGQNGDRVTSQPYNERRKPAFTSMTGP